MGNCCVRCIRLVYKRRVLRQYTSLDTNSGQVYEAEELFDDDDGDGLMNPSSSSSASPSVITENEKLLLRSKNYAAIISSQKTFDDQIDRQLAAQEERLRREEEELLKTRQSRQKNLAKTESSSKPSSKSDSEVPWTNAADSSEWNVAGGDDDFDMFIDAVATRDRSAAVEEEEEIGEDDFVSGIGTS